MKRNHTQLLATLLLALGAGTTSVQAAPPASPQGLITGKEFADIPGTAVAALTGSPKFPDNPDNLFFFPYFEWNATGDIFTAPGNYGDNYGAQIVGYFYPPFTGDYIFWINADDNAELYLSTDSDPANKKLIAVETNYSGAREYLTSGNSDVTAKDSSTYTGTEWPTTDPFFGGAKITLQQNQPYYIEALSKEGGGGDRLSVAVQDPGFLIDYTQPIPGEYLSSDRSLGAVSIDVQPQSQTVNERDSVTFSVLADGTPPYTYQWRKNGSDIADATDLNYTIDSAAVADDGAAYSVVVAGAQGTATSNDAVLTVIPDTTIPTIVGAKGSPNRTEVVLTFSEALDAASAETASNYQISSSAGPLNVTGAALAGGGRQVVLTTASQSIGTKYAVLVNNVQDTAATPNAVAADSKAVFVPTGKLLEVDGFIVFEAENYDRNLDGLWERDTTRGTPSGGASMVVPNGAGGNEADTKLEYDVEFLQSGLYTVWYRASGDSGSDDSGWFHLDGERPFERSGGNEASMSGFSGATDFEWNSDPQDGPSPFTVDIIFPGEYTIGLARREDGSFFDKFVITTDESFTPTGFGPPETREGAPGLPTVSVTGPADGSTYEGGASVTLTADASGDGDILVDRVEFLANGELVGAATESPFSFTWNNVPGGIYAIRANAIDEIGGQAVSTESVVITVGTPPPQALLVVGGPSDPDLNPSDAGVKARVEAMGWQVTVVQAPSSVTTDGDGKQLIIVSSTVSSGDVGDKFRNSPVPVLNWEQALQDNFLMTLDDGTVRGTLDAQTELDIVDPNHPLAAGLSAGVITATSEPQAYSWGTPNENAEVVATVVGNPDQALIYGYDAGATLIDGSAAPARRVMFFPGDNGFAVFSEEALQLFDAAVIWASGIQPQPPGGGAGANIAWVSFHSADDTPSQAAADAGFTSAADVGYTDLLKANGHNVTRIVTSGNPETALLNAYDLVIISRSVPSGDYQDAAEAAAWNGVTAPTMLLGGYILRSSRLGFTTGTTMTDTVGPVALTVTDPSHPIFDGIALDAGNTTVAPYANVVEFNGNTQRGVSVNMDPVAGDGNVLATIGTAEDPTFGGLVIGEWQAGAALANGGADTLAGDRLVFLTGSREADGLTSQGAGIYDLTPEGAQMFLNAVNYMAGVEPSGPAPTISIARSAGGATVTYTGKLQSADSVVGPWSDVAGATSPFEAQTNQSMKFYRAVE